jgi:hypothetical protein
MLLCLVSVLCVSSCLRGMSIKTIDLPSTPEISMSERYALVLDPYISLRDQPGEKGITVSHGRRGEIYEITGKKILENGNENTVWVNLGNGWVNQSSVDLYSSREKAVTAAQRFQ